MKAGQALGYLWPQKSVTVHLTLDFSDASRRNSSNLMRIHLIYHTIISIFIKQGF